MVKDSFVTLCVADECRFKAAWATEEMAITEAVDHVEDYRTESEKQRSTVPHEVIIFSAKVVTTN